MFSKDPSITFHLIGITFCNKFFSHRTDAMNQTKHPRGARPIYKFIRDFRRISNFDVEYLKTCFFFKKYIYMTKDIYH